ncbi:gfo/Idh/MocA family oxidoreductase [Paenibacillus sp. LMG 31461]|uniref:Gfo/Idh/MocA family oxidoreductase n=2 Tax=Paenibacillus plantarum TaxID=2654975 RepID=A0ABX1XLJ3_9BACL|nr:gfo/Idh/MocA family oxidoreductase [Paenibacillus plantarum]
MQVESQQDIGNTKRRIKAIVVGAGSRASQYAGYALTHPEQLHIVGIVDPNEIRRNRLGDVHQVPLTHRFSYITELLSANIQADAVINGTMDALHVETCLPLLAHGYDILLEKPIGISREEVIELLIAAKQYERKIMICHVLRYAPFYQEIRKRIASGDIGDILNIQTAEHVSYHHMSTAFVRGKWSNKEASGSTMLMAKCCHDMDLITWFKSGIRPTRVTSTGGIMHFREEQAPAGSGTRCLVDCAIETDCVYSAKKIYVEEKKWQHYAWAGIEQLGPSPTEQQMLASLQSDNPYGRCVWHCDNTVVDHQSVAIKFEDGSTATHNLVGNTAKPCRTVHIIGRKGEIRGVMEDGYFVVRKPGFHDGQDYYEERIQLDISDEMHGGGDLLLVGDFVRVLQGEGGSISTTSIEDSIYGHLVGFGADRGMDEGIWVGLDKLEEA